MARVIAMLAVVFGFLLGGSSAFGAAPPTDVAAVVYTYDTPAYDDVTATAPERGLPVKGYATTYDAVDRRSDGTSARQSGARSRGTYIYDDTRLLVQSDTPAGTTNRSASVRNRDLSAFERLQVAAKPAVGFAEGLGHTALTPGRLQHGTKNLTKAGVLPAWSGKTSPGIIERAFTPILEHPTATFDHTLGGTRVRGFLGDINGRQVAAFVYKEGPYQGQLASSFVPSANQLKMWGLP